MTRLLEKLRRAHESDVDIAFRGDSKVVSFICGIMKKSNNRK
jgi:hypothetical protein